MARKSRPNSNYVLSIMRDDDFSDPWGTAMGWLGGVLDVLYDGDPNMVPAQCGYTPGMGGPAIETIEAGMVWEYVHGDLPIGDPDWQWNHEQHDEKFDDLVFAAKCIDRYLDWCKAAGMDY